MRSRREVQLPRNTLLDELREKHKRRFDAVDGDHWGCICSNGADCLMIVVISALNTSEQEVIRLLKEIKTMQDAHTVEIRKLSSELVGIESYNQKLKREIDRLEEEKANETGS